MAEEEVSEAERLRKEEELKNYKTWNKGKAQIDARKENVCSTKFKKPFGSIFSRSVFISVR